MGYYLDKAPGYKKQFEELGFSPAQLNLVLEIMSSCTKLRQRSVIENLWTQSLPDFVEIQKEEVEGKFGKYTKLTAIAKIQEVEQK